MHETVVLAAIRVEDLTLFSLDYLSFALSKQLEERDFAGAEEELGLSIEDV